MLQRVGQNRVKFGQEILRVPKLLELSFLQPSLDLMEREVPAQQTFLQFPLPLVLWSRPGREPPRSVLFLLQKLKVRPQEPRR